MVTSLAKLKKMEIFFVFVICMLFLVLVNRYFFSEIKSNAYYKSIKSEVGTYMQNIETEKARKENEVYNESTKTGQVSKQISAKLIKEDSKFVLVGADDYSLSQVGENISIQNKNNKNFSIDVKDVDEYFPINGVATLDIPVAKNFFKVYEQEDFLPILGYHYVIPDNQIITDDKKFVEIHVSQFEEQVNYMTNTLGCRWFTFGDLMENYVLKNIKTPKRACAINFDDGHEDGYTLAFPILKKYDLTATFYIIVNLVGIHPYMTWQQIDDLYRNGNEIGSHTLFGDDLFNTDWFKNRFGREMTPLDLKEQIADSKTKLEERGYKIKTFAYPLGVWNDEIVKIVKDSKYLAARDTSVDFASLDKRTPTVSFDDNYIWHMHYYKPEMATEEDIKDSIAYNTWWQFENGYEINKDDNKNIEALSSLTLTSNSYRAVTLPDRGDKITNKFTTNHEGSFDIEIFGSTGEKKWDNYSALNNIHIMIDGSPVSATKGNNDTCMLVNEKYYCSYFVNKYLKIGLHTISVESDNNGFVRVDKFRVFRNLPAKNSYDLTITEFNNIISNNKS